MIRLCLRAHNGAFDPYNRINHNEFDPGFAFERALSQLNNIVLPRGTLKKFIEQHPDFDIIDGGGSGGHWRITFASPATGPHAAAAPGAPVGTNGANTTNGAPTDQAGLHAAAAPGAPVVEINGADMNGAPTDEASPPPDRDVFSQFRIDPWQVQPRQLSRNGSRDSAVPASSASGELRAASGARWADMMPPEQGPPGNRRKKKNAAAVQRARMKRAARRKEQGFETVEEAIWAENIVRWRRVRSSASGETSTRTGGAD